MSSKSLLSTISSSHKSTLALISRLSKLDGGSASVQSELTEAIRGALKDAEDSLAEVVEQISYERDLATREVLEVKTSKLRDDLKSARIAYRKALLQSKKNLESSARRERELLLGGGGGGLTPDSLRHRTPSDQAVLEASSALTTSLHRTHDLLSTSLHQSSVSLEALAQSSNTLTALQERYGAFDRLLGVSRRLVGVLERQDWVDRWCILGGLAFFLGVCAWIFWRRVVRKGVRAVAFLTGGNGVVTSVVRDELQ
ncbi:Protein transport protein sec20 [Saitoella coloradoensis]